MEFVVYVVMGNIMEHLPTQIVDWFNVILFYFILSNILGPNKIADILHTALSIAYVDRIVLYLNSNFIPAV